MWDAASGAVQSDCKVYAAQLLARFLMEFYIYSIDPVLNL